MTTTLTAASSQWFSRPDDQRYVDLASLKTAVAGRKRECWTATPDTKSMRVNPTEDGGIAVEVFDPVAAQRRALRPTNWAFGQLAQYAQAPAAYLRKLPAELAAINLQWGIERSPLRDDALVLGQSNGDHSLRAITSTSYGRIWDLDVVEAVERVNENGNWTIPAASYSAKNPKRATTLYASDRDVFIFLVDDAHPIEVKVNGQERQMRRGFYTWNSEVGSAVFGLTTFLYDYVCDNRTIWGATDIKELRIRHTGGAPERFAYEGAKLLKRYSEEQTSGIVRAIEKAAETDIPVAKDQTVAQWLQTRGFTKGVATAATATAQAEEGKVRSIWDIVNGITAYARSIPHADQRVELETQAGRLMALAQ